MFRVNTFRPVINVGGWRFLSILGLVVNHEVTVEETVDGRGVDGTDDIMVMLLVMLVAVVGTDALVVVCFVACNSRCEASMRRFTSFRLLCITNFDKLPTVAGSFNHGFKANHFPHESSLTKRYQT